MRPERIPLFPLNIVLLPDEQLPLHIFEPRYRAMVRDCLDSRTPFGMLLALSDGVVRVGCTAEILEVIKTYEDGRMDIITVGRDPFRVTQLLDDEPLLLGDVDYLEDCEMQDLSAKIAGPSRQRQLVELFETCHTLLYSSLPRDFEAESNGKLSYSIASMLPLDLMWKQQVLELRSEEERQERLLAYLREWAPHLQRQGALRHRAAGNGHGFN